MLMSGSNRQSSTIVSVFLMYVRVNAWIWSSRATRTPYHARVLRRSSVVWGNHSMLFPHGGSKKRHSGRLCQTQPAVFGCLANPSTMNQTQTLVWVAVHFYHDGALVSPEYQSLSFSSIFEWISGCPRDPNLFISKYPYRCHLLIALRSYYCKVLWLL